MTKVLLALMAGTAAIAAPASAAPLLNGAMGTAFTPFTGPAGTLLGTINATNTVADTFTADLRSAVYRNAAGTLDFWYQVKVNSIDAGDVVAGLTASSFLGYNVDALFSGAAAGDPDGAGIFTAPNNPGTFTSTASRNASGFTIRSDFGSNGLTAGETSATYIFRTNARTFDSLGTFAVRDGSTATIAGFRPIGPAVPEPATWAMMLIGFGVVGYAMRRRNAVLATA